MNFQGLIQSTQQTLTPTDWQIINAIYDHKKELPQLSMKILAQTCHVSTTTVFRCCQKLGLSGFGELKAMLKNEERAQLNPAQLSENYHHIVNYIHQYETSNLFHQFQTCQDIFILARSEMELRVAQEIQRIFQQSNYYMYILPSNQALAAQLPEMSGSLLWILTIDNQAELPTICYNRELMADIYCLLMSAVQALKFLYDDVLFIPTLSDKQPFTGQTLMTPYVLAAEMLYLKLQLHN